MARHHMHNRRASRGSGGGGTSWISYSDMMAALLLIFVLILTYSLYHYFTLLEAKTKELDEQTSALILAETELEKSRQTLIVIQDDMEELQAVMIAQAAEAELKENELLVLSTQLTEKENELDSVQLILSEKQTELDAAMIRLQEQRAAMTEQTKRIDSLVGVRSDIIRNLSFALNSSNLKATVDPNTGNIVLDSAVFFETGKSLIKPEGQELLERFIPVYLDVLLSGRYSDYLGEIIIEGHTDSSGSYTSNLKLSQDRALQVALYCLNMSSLGKDQKEKLQEILTAKGRSCSDLKYDEYGHEDAEASRRVEFKFSLKDSEMIDEMNRILKETR